MGLQEKGPCINNAQTDTIPFAYSIRDIWGDEYDTKMALPKTERILAAAEVCHDPFVRVRN